MPQINFVGPSYTMPDRQWDYQRTVNMYPVVDESQQGKTIAALVSVPGLTQFANFATEGSEPELNVVRGMFTTSDGRLFVVHGSNFARVDEDGTFEDIAVVDSNEGKIQMASNGQQLCIVDGDSAYIFNETDNSFNLINEDSTEGWRKSNVVVYIDSYFIFVEPDSQVVYISDPYNGEKFDPLMFASAEGSPDNIVTAAANNGQLWLFGTNTTEVWTNSGDEFPFTRVPGGVLQYGCTASQSVVNLANSMFWVGKDNSSSGIIYMANGLQITRISNQAVEFAISQYGDVSDATAYGYDMDGHAFYVVNFPTANVSWCYDLMTGLWHERQSYNPDTNSLNRAKPEFHAVAYGKHLVSDYSNAKIYEMSQSVYNEDGNPLVRIRRSPHMASAEYRNIQFDSFQLDYSCGFGFADKGYQDPDYENSPKAWLRWSNDGGFNWSNQHQVDLGKTGKYNTRAIWRRLGYGRSRVWEVTCSDDTRFTILGANVQWSELGA